MSEKRTAIGSKRTTIGSKRTTIGSKRTTIGSKRTTIGSKRTTIGSKRTVIGSKTKDDWFENERRSVRKRTNAEKRITPPRSPRLRVKPVSLR
jgi:guanylate cyclase 2D/E/F